MSMSSIATAEKRIVIREARKDWAEIQEMVKSYRYELDHPETNAWGQTYRISHCIHGANLWTDNDIPCGACEDGEDFHYYESLTYAQVLATTLATYRRHKARVEPQRQALVDALTSLAKIDGLGKHVNELVALHNGLWKDIQGRWYA